MQHVPRRLLVRHLGKSSSQSKGAITLDQFREAYFKPELPVTIHPGEESPEQLQGSLSPAFPRARSLWFDVDSSQERLSQGSVRSVRLGARLRQESVASAYVPYELMLSPREVPVLKEFHSWIHSLKDDLARHAADIMACTIWGSPVPGHDDGDGLEMVRFEAPLGLLSAALSFNNADRQARHGVPLRRLYIAQAAVSDLPSELQEDLSTPELVLTAGKGDIYSTSIWMGLEPTFSPWHRDPNPNLFHQLHGEKIFRLMPPSYGEQVFMDVQQRLGQWSNPRIRTAAMFQGIQGAALHEAIWGPRSEVLPEMLETRLSPGHSLFLPKGWWHSVKSSSHDGALNASVNFWFR